MSCLDIQDVLRWSGPTERRLAHACLFSINPPLIDLDDFKGINDTLGHAAGDTVLKQVTGIFKDNIRTIDWVARVGGDEFLLLLPCTTINGGLLITERIRRSRKITAWKL